MDFPSPLARGTLVSRYKRFFADVTLDDGREITAHCPNPGAMLGLNTPGLRAYVSRSDDPKRKLAHTLELVEADGGLVGINTLKSDVAVTPALVGVNTMRANGLVAEALKREAIPELSGYGSVRAEVRYGTASRVDFLLEGSNRPACWLEVKSVTLHRGDGLAEFPDCVSERGLRHVAELRAKVEAGERAVVLFVVQRNDCDRFSLASDLDPVFSDNLRKATTRGVEALAYGCEMDRHSVSITHRLRMM
ncbi:DNA/RNA nuclease SfsA [Phenylobacterium sp.]|jgi:sugar fermentation stimulation protein A|uniref:DNA/RNA nuclease SfsA n=1 Tax=Phenylobacterium sp. TaxID=1871053 RepID=UPI002E34A439|nr:DNA/RNA nuclease SfsA [Phenylobacterium sp.]HEX3366665.1 DNA/RNA nuclease SfsA [Phenylobacterium sp.]